MSLPHEAIFVCYRQHWRKGANDLSITLQLVGDWQLIAIFTLGFAMHHKWAPEGAFFLRYNVALHTNLY
jgi:hypothetical protein